MTGVSNKIIPKDKCLMSTFFSQNWANSGGRYFHCAVKFKT